MGCVVAQGGMHGCLGGMQCMVAQGKGGVHVWLLGGHAWLLWGACVVSPGGHAWLLWGGICGCSGGAYVVAPGGVCVVFAKRCVVFSRGHAWFFPGGGGGMHRTQRDTVNERAVCILLECILVNNNIGLNFVMCEQCNRAR